MLLIFSLVILFTPQKTFGFGSFVGKTGFVDSLTVEGGADNKGEAEASYIPITKKQINYNYK